MKSALVAVAMTLLIVGLVLAAYFWTRPRNMEPGGARDVEPGGFRDWVKNPERRTMAQEFFEHRRRALEVPEDISDAEVERMVDELFVPENEGFNFERLERVGDRAAPFLIEALDDPRVETKFEKQHALGASSPFERIADLLGQIGSPDAAQPLSRFVQHPDEGFRKEAALALGSIGARECLEPVTTALRDDADYVRSYAMIGIGRALKANRAQQEFLDSVFPALANLLDRRDQSVSDNAPKLLLEIDADRAMPILLSPQYFTTANGEVHYIIAALNEAPHVIPRELLLPLLDDLKPMSDKYPYDYAYGETLIAYARNPDSDTEGKLRTELEASSDRVRESAAKGLAILRGVRDPEATVFTLHEERGYAGLTTPQQQYFAVLIYNGEVNNGGHSQFFVNSSGYYWKEALSGLRAIGAPERAQILEEAVRLFGVAGPAREDDTRHSQLAQFSPEQDKVLDDLDQRYYACTENVDVLLTLYATEHRDDFIIAHP
jgi:HEAT repeat protein